MRLLFFLLLFTYEVSNLFSQEKVAALPPRVRTWELPRAFLPGFDTRPSDDSFLFSGINTNQSADFSTIEDFFPVFSPSDDIRESSVFTLSTEKYPAQVVLPYTYSSSCSQHDPIFQQFRSGLSEKGYYPHLTTYGKIRESLRKEARLYGKGLLSFYSWDTALNFGVALAVAAPIANTSADWSFHTWYQNDVRSRDLDHFSSKCKILGDGYFAFPLLISLGLSYRYLKVDGWEQKQFDQFGGWASRSGRALFVGFPALLLGQIVLGSGRPYLGSDASYWDPFNSPHAISGHAFIGAVPFITAAQMTDRIWLKTLFYGGSMLGGWSRINDDAHFISQVLLGWYLAYLSCRSISRIEDPHFGRGLTLFPVLDSEMSGCGVIYRY